MTPFRKWLCFLCLMATGYSAAADGSNSEYQVTSWRNEEGLPHGTINSILQTHDGYLWLGTYVGLVRFDGIRFVQYSSRNVPDLEAGRIAHLFEDRDGTLWVALESGRLLAWKDGVERIVLAGGSTNHPVISMAQQTNGTLWLQTGDGALGRVTEKGVAIVSPAATSVNRKNLGLVVDAHDDLWVGTSKGLQVWRDGALLPVGFEKLNGQPLDAIEHARDGKVWVFCKQRLWKVGDGKVIEQLDAPEGLNEATGMLEASDGVFWLGSNLGSLFCRKPGAGWQELPKSGFQGLNRVLYEDHEGNLWRGGFSGGLTRIRRKAFTLHEPRETNLDRYARAVCVDSRGNVWAVLNNQILCRIPAGSDIPEPITNPSNPHGIKTLFVDHEDSLWVGVDGGDLFRLRDGTFFNELNVGSGVETINALFEDTGKNLWIGYTGGTGVAMLPGGDPTKRRIIEGMPFPDVRTIAQDGDGAMWFGTHYGGAFQWQQGKWLRLTTREGLPSDYVRCLLADPEGGMWLGTLHGLCRWRNGKLVTITSEQGLWNDAISNIADDGRGNFWISSFGGVFRVKRADLNDFVEGRRQAVQCVGYDHNDGLVSVECSGGFQPAGAKSRDGKLWLPTAGGLVSIDPARIGENTLPPPSWIESVNIDDKPVGVMHSTGMITVPPGKRRFDFRFTALSFTAPEKVLFRHRLHGLETEWSEPDRQRTVTYNYLPPGRYNFEVKACNNDGYWNTGGQSLQLDLRPFIWQTTSFKVGIGLVLAAGLAWSVRKMERWKAQMRLERLEGEHAIERERSRIAKDIHDDLGANLTQIVFLSQRMEGSGHDPVEFERWNKLIPATASRTIQSLDEIVWAINPKHDTLESLANYLSRFAQEFLSLAGIRCNLDVPTVLPAVPLSAEVRHNLVLTAREALQNIVTHAAATEVQVRLQVDEGGLKIEIADNGNGFATGQPEGEGNGLPNMRKRLEDIAGTLEIMNEPGQGTKIRFSVPRRQLHGRVVGKT